MEQRIVMGPVLSFRGAEASATGTVIWKVSALVMVEAGATAPVLEAEGQALGAPVLLHRSPAGDAYRYDLSRELGAREQRVHYNVQGCPPGRWPDTRRWSFTVPKAGQAPRMAYFSCNGFSDPRQIKTFRTAANRVWHDLLCNHDKALRPADYVPDREQQWHESRCHAQGVQRFHLALGGGDQVYMDGIWAALPELRAWAEMDDDEQLSFKPSQALLGRIEKYYWQTYADRWSMVPLPKLQNQPHAWHNAGWGFASMPTVMMWDDHDIFDGWGSYSPAKQRCALLREMFRIARQAFWVCQLQMRLIDLPAIHDFTPQARDPLYLTVTPPASKGAVPDIDAQAWTRVRRADPLSLAFLEGQPGFHHRLDLGEVAVCVMDLRTERSQRQVLSQKTWEAWQTSWAELPALGPSHVLVLSSVPVAHPKLGLAEDVVTHLASDDVVTGLADDLNDHWSHDRHEDERKRLVRSLVALGERAACRVTLVSGDVHVAAWGFAGRNLLASNGQRINQLTSTAIVHPSPATYAERLFIWYLNRQGRKPQLLDTEHTISMMNFPGTSEIVMAARNWLALEADEDPREEYGCRPRLWATWRTEQNEDFRNHLLAVHPYKATASGQQLVPAEGGFAVASRGR